MKIDRDTVVSAHYRGTLTEDGTEFDSSQDREPITFLVGHHQMISGFENGVMGAVVGDERTFEITPDEAYGDYDPEGVKRMPKEGFPPEVKVGMTLAAEMEDGHVIPMRILEVAEEEVVVDFNNSLAGKNLTFEVTIVEVRPATDTELAHGHAHGPGGHHH